MTGGQQQSALGPKNTVPPSNPSSLEGACGSMLPAGVLAVAAPCCASTDSQLETERKAEAQAQQGLSGPSTWQGGSPPPPMLPNSRQPAMPKAGGSAQANGPPPRVLRPQGRPPPAPKQPAGSHPNNSCWECVFDEHELRFVSGPGGPGGAMPSGAGSAGGGVGRPPPGPGYPPGPPANPGVAAGLGMHPAAGKGPIIEPSPGIRVGQGSLYPPMPPGGLPMPGPPPPPPRTTNPAAGQHEAEVPDLRSLSVSAPPAPDLDGPMPDETSEGPYGMMQIPESAKSKNYRMS